MSDAHNQRPSWDDYFMAIARIVATRSTCDRLEGGAILVKNKRIISSGYTGAPPGLPHCDDVGHLMEEGHCVRTIHAEHNAILQAASIGSISTEGSTMYAVYLPCIHCAKYLVGSGIKRLVFGKIYRNAYCINYLKEAGVLVEEYQPNQDWNSHLEQLFTRGIEERKPIEGDVKLRE